MNDFNYKYLGKTERGKLFYTKADALEHIRSTLAFDFPELDPTKTTVAMAIEKCFEKIECTPSDS